MPGESKRIALNRLFEGSQRRMVAELMSIRQAVEHGGVLGDETEVAWVKFLDTMLPDRYRVSDGFVVDADGRCSDQIDAIVFDRQYSPPLFRAENVQYVPAEAVYAVFEVKQKIDSNRLKNASSKVASVRRLRRTSAPIPTAGGMLGPKDPGRIIGGILALSVANRTTLENTIATQMVHASEESRLDLGCAVDDGTFTVSYKESNSPTIKLSSGRSSLITFFLEFQSMLQSLGTAPAIDYSEYMRAIPDSN